MQQVAAEFFFANIAGALWGAPHMRGQRKRQQSEENDAA